MRLLSLLPALWSADAGAALASAPDLTHHWAGITALAIFVVAYALVISEEKTHLRKSKPVLLAAGLIWAVIAVALQGHPDDGQLRTAVNHALEEYCELLLFLLAAMTYVNAMAARGVFDSLRASLVSRGWSYRKLFWATGVLAFLLSPLIDNLTTALVMCAVLLAVGKDNPRFVSLGCINVVVGANAGGAFSPFGDITTLMVWQAGLLPFHDFFALFLPSLVNFLVPAVLMTPAIPAETPAPSEERAVMQPGGLVVIGLFAATVTTAVCFHMLLGLPPFLGMVTGLGYLMLYTHISVPGAYGLPSADGDYAGKLSVFREIARAEWDTLLFFFGVVTAVGGLSYIGYLQLTSAYFYGELGATVANTLVGIISAIVDNIPVMVAVLQMEPHMDEGQWLLVTLTAGVGGSLLSVGSAAGVALMGQARGYYTFFSHLAWTPAIALGYALSIATHLFVNGALFQG